MSAALLAAMVVGAQAQVYGKSVRGTPVALERGVTETVAQIVARDTLRPKYEPGTPPVYKKEEDKQDRRGLKNAPTAQFLTQWPTPYDPNAINRTSLMAPKNPQTVSTNWQGITLNESGFIPPDTQGAVGPTQVLMAANGRIKVFNKTGTVGGLNVGLDAFFALVDQGTGVSDPRVRFDPISQRWFVAAINLANGGNRILLAVSSGPTITNSSSFTFFFFKQDATGGGTQDNGLFADYPTLGIDANALYIGANMFGSGFAGCTVWVVRKSSILAAGPIVVTTFRRISSGTVQGLYTPQGVDNWDASIGEGYFIGPGTTTFGSLFIRRITNPGTTPTISGNLTVSGVLATTNPIDVPSQGGSALDGLDDRLFHAVITKNRLTGLSTLWTAHNIQVNTAGVASNTGGRNGSRWYEIQDYGTANPSVRQVGTMFDSAATNPRSYWIPSVIMSGQGHATVGVTQAGATTFAGVAFGGRLGTDALGTTRPPTVALNSSTAYTVGGSPTRWGDYSFSAMDPTDDMTMWTFQTYATTGNQWACRAVKLLAPPPAPIVSLTPNTLEVGQTATIVVTGSTSTAGQGYFDPGPGFNRLQAAFSGAGLTVNSVTFNSPTQATLNVTASNSAAVGGRNLTITNPDGQSTGLNNALTLTPRTSFPDVTTWTTGTGATATPALVASSNNQDALATLRYDVARNDPNAALQFEAPALPTVSSLEIQVESRTTFAGLNVFVELWNFSTNAWVRVGAAQVSAASDSVFTRTQTTNPNQYLSSGRIRGRVTFFRVNPLARTQAFVDQIVVRSAP